MSLHGYEQLAADEIHARDAVDGLGAAVVVEDYPITLTIRRGHAYWFWRRIEMAARFTWSWGISAGRDSPAVLITGYRPDPKKWDKTWQRRRT